MSIIDKLSARIERGKASDRAIAEASGMSIEEYDRATTMPDPQPAGTPDDWAYIEEYCSWDGATGWDYIIDPMGETWRSRRLGFDLNEPWERVQLGGSWV